MTITSSGSKGSSPKRTSSSTSGESKLKVYLADSLTQINPKEGIYFDTRDNIIDFRNKVFLSIDSKLLLPSFIEFSKSQKRLANSEKVLVSGKIFIHSILSDLNRDSVVADPRAFLDNSGRIYDELYVIYKKIYTSLEKNDFVLLIESLLYTNFPGLFSEYSNSYDKLQEDSEKSRRYIFSKYLLVKPELTKKILKSIIEDGVSGARFKYSLISSIIYVPISKSPLDIYKIIREIKLSDYIPIAYTFEEDTNKPVFKIFKNADKSQVKDWIVNYETKKGGIQVKRLKGLTFKINETPGSYINVFLSKREPRFTVFFNRTIPDNSVIGDIPKFLSNLKQAIAQINSINGSHPLPTIEYKIRYSRVYFEFLTKINVNELLKVITKIRNLEILPNDSVLKIKLIYLPKNISVIVRNNSNLQLNFQITGARTENDINDVILEMANVVALATKKVSSSSSNTKKDSSSKKDVSKLADIDITTGCQTTRRPRILKDNEVSSTYSLTKNGVSFTCNDSINYKYPGYTVKNVVCCFAKDQRSKQVFKRNQETEGVATNTQRQPVKVYTDKFIISKPLIITSKILEKNRTGILPGFLGNYFSDAYVRLGTSVNEKDSFLDAIANCYGKALTKEKILKSITTELFPVLENGEIKEIYGSLTNFKKHIQDDTTGNHTDLIDLIQNIIQKNIIVITDNRVLSCSKTKDFEYKQFILIYKNKSNYEAVVKIADYKTLQRQFSKDDIKEFLELYNSSCQINYIYRNNQPISANKIKELNIQILGQIINSYENLSFLFTEYGLLPVSLRKKLTGVKEYEINEVFLTAKEQAKLLLKLNISQYLPVSQILDATGKTVAIVTNTSMVIPVKASVKAEGIPVEEDLEYLGEPLREQKNKNLKIGHETFNILKDLEMYQRLRFTLSTVLNSRVSSGKAKKEILKIKQSITIPFANKNTLIQKIINSAMEAQVYIGKTSKQTKSKALPTRRRVCKEISANSCGEDPFCIAEQGQCLLYVEKKSYSSIIKRLSLEILNSNEIVENLVKAEQIGKENFIKRENEVILLTKEDILEYFKPLKI